MLNNYIFGQKYFKTNIMLQNSLPSAAQTLEFVWLLKMLLDRALCFWQLVAFREMKKFHHYGISITILINIWVNYQINKKLNLKYIIFRTRLYSAEFPDFYEPWISLSHRGRHTYTRTFLFINICIIYVFKKDFIWVFYIRQIFKSDYSFTNTVIMIIENDDRKE